MVKRRLGYIIKRAQQVLRQRMGRELDSASLTTPQYAELTMLKEDPDISNAELARRCFLAPQTMHKIVTGLEDKGLVERKSDPSHGRKINTLLTPNGEKKLGKAHEIVKDIEVEMAENLTEKEVEQTINSLEKCISGLEEG